VTPGVFNISCIGPVELAEKLKVQTPISCALAMGWQPVFAASTSSVCVYSTMLSVYWRYFFSYEMYLAAHFACHFARESR
jgi:hypothetical protein